jgi:hypothetical protein
VDGLIEHRNLFMEFNEQVRRGELSSTPPISYLRVHSKLRSAQGQWGFLLPASCETVCVSRLLRAARLTFRPGL